MQNEKVDMNFYLNESILYYKGIRNRILKLDVDEAKKYDTKEIEKFKNKIEYSSMLSTFVRKLLNNEIKEGEHPLVKKINKELGIIIPKWIELFEDKIYIEVNLLFLIYFYIFYQFFIISILVNFKSKISFSFLEKVNVLNRDRMNRGHISYLIFLSINRLNVELNNFPTQIFLKENKLDTPSTI